MSYCRFGEADAYIFDHVDLGLVCMACWLMPVTEETDPFPDTFVAGYDRQKMLDHIEDHRDAGHNIPFDVDLRLRKEIEHIESCPCNRADERGEDGKEDDRKAERDKVAREILDSETFMWLMAGSEREAYYLRELRRAYLAYCKDLDGGYGRWADRQRNKPWLNKEADRGES